MYYCDDKAVNPVGFISPAENGTQVYLHVDTFRRVVITYLLNVMHNASNMYVNVHLIN